MTAAELADRWVLLGRLLPRARRMAYVVTKADVDGPRVLLAIQRAEGLFQAQERVARVRDRRAAR